ncbi:FAS1-like dehydratase domain-containing protein [Haloechinothrix salitolerans]|uniref:MaoC family dehydratase N-terminal domain-containing protein n=1 Tax=Haloechinothrix salitolerans TaxID=926830 RepID=A0ABW2BXG8_9PSEU
MSRTRTEQIVDDVTFEVERGKILEFARATHTQDQVHTDTAIARANGFNDVLATPTHVAVAGHYRDQRGFVTSLGLAMERVVVGKVRWEYFRPLAAGDKLRGRRRVVSDERREGKRSGQMRLITLATDYIDARGDVVVRQSEVLVERGEQA